jgi:predicted dehydrogenase
MVDAARKHNATVQVGTQRRTSQHLIECKDRVIKEDKLGKVGHVTICCYWDMWSKQNPPDSDPPESLDYEMWTGPAPMRPFNKLIHPAGFRHFKEYANGIVGDMGIHLYDLVRWFLDLGWAKTISASGGQFIRTPTLYNTPDTMTAVFGHDGLDVVWNHRTWGGEPDEWPWAATFYGEKGILKADHGKWEFTPYGAGGKLSSEGKLTGKFYKETEPDKYPFDKTQPDKFAGSPPDRLLVKNLLECRKTKQRPVCDIEGGHMSTAACILAELSMDLGRELHWDGEKHEVTGDPEATKKLIKPYRAPWVHPATKTT